MLNIGFQASHSQQNLSLENVRVELLPSVATVFAHFGMRKVSQNRISLYRIATRSTESFFVVQNRISCTESHFVEQNRISQYRIVSSTTESHLLVQNRFSWYRIVSRSTESNLPGQNRSSLYRIVSRSAESHLVVQNRHS
jgi:hypothetical protein